MPDQNGQIVLLIAFKSCTWYSRRGVSKTDQSGWLVNYLNALTHIGRIVLICGIVVYILFPSVLFFFSCNAQYNIRENVKQFAITFNSGRVVLLAPKPITPFVCAALTTECPNIELLHRWRVSAHAHASRAAHVCIFTNTPSSNRHLHRESHMRKWQCPGTTRWSCRVIAWCDYIYIYFCLDFIVGQQTTVAYILLQMCYSFTKYMIICQCTSGHITLTCLLPGDISPSVKGTAVFCVLLLGIKLSPVREHAVKPRYH